MREIMYRGIDKDSGEFVYGDIAFGFITESEIFADAAIIKPNLQGVSVHMESVGILSKHPSNDDYDLKIIGNIHQNPELLSNMQEA